MKKRIRIFIALLSLALSISLTNVSFAQGPNGPPPPPPGGGGGGGTGTGQGGNQGAPIGDGMFLLLGLAGLYAGRKLYLDKTADKTENKEESTIA